MNTMDKEEILEKSRRENRVGDERELQVRDISLKWAFVVMVLMFTVFSFIRSEQGLPTMDFAATLAAAAFANMTYRFVKTKEKAYLFVALIMLITAIMATVRFFMGH
jgi:hypothetical protein